jgi:hypothetical protein
VTTRIWIEPVNRPDGRNWYTDRGLCDRVHNAICETCRVLMSRGITGPFETWKAGIPYPCMTGDIARTAGVTVHEPHDGVCISLGGDPSCRMLFPALRSSRQREEGVSGRVVAPT